MKKKSVFILSVMASIILMAVMVLGAHPLTDPADGGTASGATFLVNGSAGLGGVDDCELTVTDVSGLTNLTVATTDLAANHTNTTVSRDLYNFTINTNALNDHTAYNFSVACSNFTGGVQSLNWSDGVTVGNTVPTAPSSLSTTKQTSTGFSLTGTVNDIQTTSCTVNFQTGFPGSSKPTCSYSGSTATVAITGAGDGSYCYTITASDGTDTTKSSEACFIVDAKGDSAIGTLTPEQIQEQITGKKAVASRGEQIANFFKGMLMKLGNALRGLFN